MYFRHENLLIASKNKAVLASNEIVVELTTEDTCILGAGLSEPLQFVMAYS